MKGSNGVTRYEILKIEETLDISKLTEAKKKEIRGQTEINYSVEYENVCKEQFVREKGEAGLEFINQEVINNQKNVVSYVLGKIGQNLLEGKSLINVGLPLNLFDERSGLEFEACKLSARCPMFDLASTKTGLERFKTVLSGFVSGFHLYCGMTKPFNPILGETFHCFAGRTELFLEQVSHHPPLTRLYVFF